MAASDPDTSRSTGQGREGPPRLFTVGGMAVLAVAALLVEVTSADRYRDPVGEKYIPIMAPSGADFRPTFTGTRAHLKGMNPMSTRCRAGGTRGAGLRRSELEREAILRTLEAVGGSTSRAAAMLDISARKIQYKLKEYQEQGLVGAWHQPDIPTSYNPGLG